MAQHWLQKEQHSKYRGYQHANLERGFILAWGMASCGNTTTGKKRKVGTRRWERHWREKDRSEAPAPHPPRLTTRPTCNMSMPLCSLWPVQYMWVPFAVAWTACTAAVPWIRAG
eukprot:1156272-Pelagomonas_calceolata.AAC.5